MHDFVQDVVYHIIHELHQPTHRKRIGFLPSSPRREGGGCVNFVISDAVVGHTLVDIVVSDLTRRDLVERAARQDLVTTTAAKQGKETHNQDRAAGKKFVPFVLETYGAPSVGSDFCLVKCATLASRECVGSGSSISFLCTWFRQRVSIATVTSTCDTC